MAARDSSISPTSTSPRSISPRTTVPSGVSRDGLTIPHPLRQSETHGGEDTGVQQNGSQVSPGPATSVKFDLSPAGQASDSQSPALNGSGSAGEEMASHPVNGIAASRIPPVPASGPSTSLPNPRVASDTTNEPGSATPPARRSVQFARSSTFDSGPTHSHEQSGDIADIGGAGGDRHVSRLMSKLKSLTTTPLTLPGNARSQGSYFGADAIIDEGLQSGPISSTPERERIHNDGSEADADAEESATEGPSVARPPKKRRKSRRHDDEGTQTAPTTPKITHLPSWLADSPGATPTSPPSQGRGLLFRRATMTDIPEHQRQGLSEDEGRDRLAKDPLWIRRNPWHHGARGLSYSAGRPRDHEESPDARRPSNFRRITGMRSSHAAEPSPSTWRRRTERTGSLSAQKWRQIKAGLKMLGQKRKEENKIDQAKSAELVAELLAVTPAALLFASMFQHDEHGNKRIPVLLEQLKVRVVDSHKVDGDRHVLFRMELEYGSGVTRMKWVIKRTLRDFANLHLKYKLQGQTEKYIQLRSEDTAKAKMPRFPKSAFPYMRGVRGLMEEDEEEDDDAENSGHDGDASGPERPGKNRRRRSSFVFSRRKSSISAPQTPGVTADAVRNASVAAVSGQPGMTRVSYQDRQRTKLESYLQQMITWCMFRAEGNRLCKFLELSALGVRLAPEGSYHGKEGVMMIRTKKGVDIRARSHPRNLVNRRQAKWVLIRSSYVVCVESPAETEVYDVFLVDSDFTIDMKKRLRDENPQDLAKRATSSAAHPQQHSLRLKNSERKLKLLAKNERQLGQFEESIRFMAQNTVWSQPHRFDSYAPVRRNVFAEWLVDGQEYMWMVSRAISMARDVIFIHDWWLSPELYMRRPAVISSKWRLDRLLEQKAKEGVKIYIIMYRNINSAIPIDSEYSKLALLDLHTNVFVQRSPNQFRQNTFFWAHHEKLCVVDNLVAFCGGIDLCFGRWDTPQHRVVDDMLTGFELDNDMPKDVDNCQVWPGKDYSNPRVQDFYGLERPYEEMYDRTKVPRMPWHDISMKIVGQPARDLSRHFIQRWNYILRQRKPSRPTPFLLPPPDFNPNDLEMLGLDGTCEVQMLRSAAWWSLGTPDRTEHSIMNAYVKMIETSDHFVYIENQFFISSCYIEGTRVENRIGDALYERIARAHRDQEDWRAIVVIPLMPGFQNAVDNQDGTSIRLIMSCQYKSICRGESSLFERLRAVGCEPEDYIQFYSLRSWGKIGPTKSLTTEQLYIHAKCMIVDDRVAIIGSANINERSMLGSRDSEVAAVIRDSNTLPSVMAGEPYDVGHFPHTLRMRLMREHLGLDVDEITDEERLNPDFDSDLSSFHSDVGSSGLNSPTVGEDTIEKLIRSKNLAEDDLIRKQEQLHGFGPDHHRDLEGSALGSSGLQDVHEMEDHDQPRARGDGHGDVLGFEGLGRDSSDTAGNGFLTSNFASDGRSSFNSRREPGTRSRARSNARESVLSAESHGNPGLPPRPPRMNTDTLGLTQLSQLPALPVTDDTDIGGPPLHRTMDFQPSEALNDIFGAMKHPVVTKDCMKDPVSDPFFLDCWHAVAENNTKLFRHVFRCMPDSEVKTWREFKQYNAFADRFNELQGLTGRGNKAARPPHQEDAPNKSGPPGNSMATKLSDQIDGLNEKLTEKLPSITIGRDSQLGKVEQWAETQAAVLAGADPEKAAASAAAHTAAAAAAAPGPRHDSTSTSTTLPPPAAPGTLAAGSQSPQQPPQPPPPTPSAPALGAGDDASTAAAKLGRERTVTYSEPASTTATAAAPSAQAVLQKRRRRATTRSSARAFHAGDDAAMLSKADAEHLLERVQGHLVLWPYDWLEKEEKGGGWLYAVDQIAPLEIYS